MSTGGFRCLAIETATDLPGVAACCDDQVAERQFGGARQTQDVFSHVDAVLAAVGLELHQLDCIAVGAGPGSFTGLRVGVAAAQALAFGAGLPVCPQSSLAAMALGAAQPGDPILAAPAFDARMGEVYAGLYRVGAATVETVLPDCLAAPGELELPGDEAFVAVGPGWSAYPELAARYRARTVRLDSQARPRATQLLGLAARDFRAGRTVAPVAVVPRYLRDRVTG